MNWISRRRYDNSQSPHLWWIIFQSVMSLQLTLNPKTLKPVFCMTGDGNNFVVFGGGRSAVCTCAFQTEGNMYSYILQSQ